MSTIHADLEQAAHGWEQEHAPRFTEHVTPLPTGFRATIKMPHPAATDLRLTVHADGPSPPEARVAARQVVRRVVTRHFMVPGRSAAHATQQRLALPYRPLSGDRHVAAVLVAEQERPATQLECAAASLHVRLTYGISIEDLVVEHIVRGVREQRAAVNPRQTSLLS